MVLEIKSSQGFMCAKEEPHQLISIPAPTSVINVDTEDLLEDISRGDIS